MRKIILFLLISVTVFSCTDLEETLYSGISRDNFYNNEEEVTAAILRVYEHGRWFFTNTFDAYVLEELTADQLVVSQKGGHWYDQGKFIRFHRHEWTSEEPELYGTWRGAFIGVALSNTLIDELGSLDYTQIPGNLTPEMQQMHINEMRILRAHYYYHLVSWFGTLPISEISSGASPDPSSRLEVFNWAVSELEEATELMPEVTYRNARGRLNKAAGKLLLARFYLNSEVWTGTPRYAEAEQIARAIIDGQYGNFQLDPTFYGPFAHDNAQNSNEVIYGFAREYTYTGNYNNYNPFYHYQAPQYFGSIGQPWNGFHLQPSRVAPVRGTDYPVRESHPRFIPVDDYDRESLAMYNWSAGIGNPYEKFHDDDLRKQPFNFAGPVGVDNKDFNQVIGMFLEGHQDSPITGITGTGSNEYPGQDLVFVDFVARASEGSNESATSQGEENTGIRLVKYPVYPQVFDGYMNADWTEFRLAEAYYILAETLIRQGKPGAADAINAVKQRNFVDYAPHAYTDAELDLDEMLAEWGREFLGERRRRTDLIRFGKFGEAWWDKTSSASTRELFPYPARVLSTNPNLVQNPGY
jgi:starch-binding outer membrane protein, SusD/RagB family